MEGEPGRPKRLGDQTKPSFGGDGGQRGPNWRPAAHQGQIWGIRPRENGSNANADALYALQYGGSIFIKRVMMKADGGVVLISDNERYPAQTIDDPESLRVVGRVVLVFNVREP